MGGENNWNDGTNSVILGMKNNILARGENNAIVGTNVRINSDTDNVFVRSDNPTSEF
ncbi:MAG: hypothetical protein LBD11_06855 [Candidatus Peribacteria bacterium]|jgi:hypothetical protein|nr:hypothetical protein [Candidatus Peribacteria bacterium]